MQIASVILAAGQSRRMGFPKALLRIGEETALERVVRLCRGVAMDPVVVVLGFHAARIRAEVDLQGVSVVHNQDPERGQTSSLQVGLRAVPPRANVCLFPVDHAGLRHETLQGLVKAFRARTAEREIAVPSHDGHRGHPVLFSATVAEELLDLAVDQPAHRVIRRESARLLHWTTTDTAVRRDWDCPGDLPPGVRLP